MIIYTYIENSEKDKETNEALGSESENEKIES